jgi:hypothetical protein
MEIQPRLNRIIRLQNELELCRSHLSKVVESIPVYHFCGMHPEVAKKFLVDGIRLTIHNLEKELEYLKSNYPT